MDDAATYIAEQAFQSLRKGGPGRDISAVRTRPTQFIVFIVFPRHILWPVNLIQESNGNACSVSQKITNRRFNLDFPHVECPTFTNESISFESCLTSTKEAPACIGTLSISAASAIVGQTLVNI
jgi:hypothetical protein